MSPALFLTFSRRSICAGFLPEFSSRNYPGIRRLNSCRATSPNTWRVGVSLYSPVRFLPIGREGGNFLVGEPGRCRSESHLVPDYRAGYRYFRGEDSDTLFSLIVLTPYVTSMAVTFFTAVWAG